MLAGERPGGNALARAHNAPSSLTLDLNGRPVIDWTLSALEASRLERLLLVGPGEQAAVHPCVIDWCARGHVTRLEPASGPAASAIAGAEKAKEWPVLLTAADHALLQAKSINEFCEQASQIAVRESADFVVGVVDYAAVKKRFPESKRTLLKFADGACCGSNLFLLATPDARQTLQFWSTLEALRKTPWKIAGRLGFSVCVRYLLGALTIADAFAVLSARTGTKISFCKLTEAELAVDVDSVADLELAADVLRSRGAS